MSATVGSLNRSVYVHTAARHCKVPLSARGINSVREGTLSCGTAEQSLAVTIAIAVKSFFTSPSINLYQRFARASRDLVHSPRTRPELRGQTSVRTTRYDETKSAKNRPLLWASRKRDGKFAPFLGEIKQKFSCR